MSVPRFIWHSHYELWQHKCTFLCHRIFPYTRSIVVFSIIGLKLPLPISRQFGPYLYATRHFSTVGAKFISNMDATSRKAQLLCDRKKLEEALPHIIEQVLGPFCAQTNDATEHFRKSLAYNLPGGKMNRAMAVLSTWRILLGNRVPSEEDYNSAIALAWCVELLQAAFLVADDVMDQSQSRRGKPCWYKQEDIGLVAINDAFMLECSVYRLVDIKFQDKKCYPNLIALVHKTTFQTEIGQTLDLITEPGDNFCNFTEERYQSIVRWKTGYYSFYFPVALAMYMMDITDKDVHEKAKEILLDMGEFFQIQDDYLDCYGDPKVTGKVGTDIEDKKCSWLLVQALMKVDQTQMDVLKENYGIRDPNAVAMVKEIYAQLNIVSVYKDYEERSYAKLMALIETAPSNLPKEIFTELAAKIYKRTK